MSATALAFKEYRMPRPKDDFDHGHVPAMQEREERIRRKAHDLWVQEGCPEGRADIHWDEASELVAIEDSQGYALLPRNAGAEDVAEPVEAFRNQGDFPGMADQGRQAPGPSLERAVDVAEAEDSRARPVRKPRKSAR